MRLFIFTFLFTCLLAGNAQFQSTALSTRPAFIKSKTSDVPHSRNCYANEMDARLREKYPNLPDRAAFETALQQKISLKSSQRTAAEQVYKIKTIVHVIHNGQAVGSGPNISAAQVNSQFTVLNEDFRRLGAGFNDHPDGADILVEFVPATTDPDGNVLSEPGIDRVNGGKSTWDEASIEDNLKPATIWDPERYLNIWVASFGGDLNDVLGYAQFPSLSGLSGLFDDEGPANTDGVVIGYRFFGNTGNVASPYDKGRTATHEIGHWLGLIHIWGDGNCAVDDFCADTPNANGPNEACVDRDSCPSDNASDMIENYMDYTPDACMNIFTQDQKDRMRAVLEISPRRKTLYGPLCGDATVAALGTNTNSEPGWFSYTAQSSGIVTVSSVGSTTVDTYLSIKKSCDGEIIQSNDNALGTSQSEISLQVTAGDELKINWSDINSSSAFNWTINESAIGEGLVCGASVEASIGSNSIPVTSSHFYWYHYSQTDDLTKLSIDAPNTTYSVYTGSCDGLELIHSGSGLISLTSIDQGEEVYIQFEANGGNKSWILTTAVLAEGESCQTAKSAELGSNNFTQAPYWYTYTATNTGTLVVSNVGQTNIHSDATLYNACTGEVIAENIASGNQTGISTTVVQGDIISILWNDTYSAEGFNWTLSFEDIDLGLLCEAPKVATVGDNYVPQVESDGFWFKFIPPASDMKYKITSSANEYLAVVRTSDCENYELLGYAFENAYIVDVTADEEIIIYWELENSTGDFHFTITEQSLVSGDLCSSPKEAAQGVNINSYTPNWYHFTMPSDGKVTVSTRNMTQEDTYLYILSGCDGGILAENDDISSTNFQSEASISDLSAGDEILIYWAQEYTSSGFNWKLTITEAVTGDTCQKSATAILGVNTVSVIPSTLYWTKYTVPASDKKLLITSSSEEFVYVMANCDADIISEGYENLTATGLEANQEVYIVWELANAKSFTWSLSIEDLQEGDDCSVAVNAFPGTNNAPYSPYWFRYEVPQNATVKISSRNTTEEDTDLLIFSDCDGTLIKEHDDISDEIFQSEITLTDLMAGTVLYIFWRDTYTTQGFDWNLTLSNVDNATPVITDQTFLIEVNTAEADQLIGVIEASDADSDPMTYQIMSGNSQNFFRLDQSTGELFFDDLTGWSDEDQLLKVQVSDGISSKQANITIKIDQEILGSEIQLKEIYPNPAQNVVYLPSTLLGKISSAQITDLSGKVLHSYVNVDSKINTSELAEGLYVLLLETNAGDKKSFKVYIKR